MLRVQTDVELHPKVADVMKKIGVFVEVMLIVLVTMWVFFGCAPRKYAYKVTFTDGTVEFYELNYRVKPGAKAIDFDDETICGVKEFEKVK